MKKVLGLTLILMLVAVTANAAVVDFDKRNNPRAPIAVEQVNFDIVGGSDSESLTLNGDVTRYILIAEDLSGSCTLTVNVVNESSAPLYDQKTISGDNTTTVTNLTPDTYFQVAETTTWTISTSDAQEAGDVELQIYYK